MSAGKPEFHPEQTGGVDTLDGFVIQFDYDAVDAFSHRLTEQFTESDAERFAQPIGEFLRFGVKPLTDSKFNPKSFEVIGKRLVALVWTISPALIEGSPSLSEMAAAIGIHKTTLSVHAADARRRFHTRNRLSGHSWNFKPTGVNHAT